MRVALWEDAGIERSAEQLRRLVESPHPLVRLIGRSALKREESRGTHTRSDYPERDARLDSRHVVASEDDEQLDWQTWQ